LTHTNTLRRFATGITSSTSDNARYCRLRSERRITSAFLAAATRRPSSAQGAEPWVLRKWMTNEPQRGEIVPERTPRYRPFRAWASLGEPYPWAALRLPRADVGWPFGPARLSGSYLFFLQHALGKCGSYFSTGPNRSVQLSGGPTTASAFLLSRRYTGVRSRSLENGQRTFGVIRLRCHNSA
jgi:hypothetical protein